MTDKELDEIDKLADMHDCGGCGKLIQEVKRLKEGYSWLASWLRQHGFNEPADKLTREVEGK